MLKIYNSISNCIRYVNTPTHTYTHTPIHLHIHTHTHTHARFVSLTSALCVKAYSKLVILHELCLGITIVCHHLCCLLRGALSPATVKDK